MKFKRKVQGGKSSKNVITKKKRICELNAKIKEAKMLMT